ncbi:hypothetical protein ABTY61_28180 [Kitasatospora sp. NPDC096128]|uniref:hypothetical protein n=1 Tax=Kitasatospora sp. NPDC096128 TaxID=3155547 RepID=UPI003333A4D2
MAGSNKTPTPDFGALAADRGRPAQAGAGAAQRLADERLVAHGRNRGVFVRVLTPADVRTYCFLGLGSVI